jgi:polar amino acid transport system substrate-binding protein
MEKLRKVCLGALVLCTGGFALSACGSSASSSDESAGGGASTAGAQVAALKDGALDVFSSGDYPPYSYLDKDGKTMHGMENEMLELIAKKLGVQLKYHVAQFDTMIPGIANRRADLMVMAMADTTERRQQVDFIDLYKTNYRVVTRKGNPSGLQLGADPAKADPMGLCGKKGAAVTGSGMESTLKILSANCTKAGKPAIKLLAFPVGTQEYLSVKTGRADFDLFVPANADFFLKSNTDLEALPGSFANPQTGYTGWIVGKHSTDLQTKVIGAINALIDEGSWGRLLAKYGVGETDAVLPPLRNGQPTT